MADRQSEFPTLTDAELAAELSRVCATICAAGEITVGVLVGGRSACAVIDADHGARAFGADAPRVLLGCVTKALTGMLAMIAARERQLDFTQDTAALATAYSLTGANGLRGTTVRQLLGHSHGVDTSHMECVERAADGRIDPTIMFDSMAGSTRLFEPGTLYSYSSAGSWIVAAILEHAYAMPFANLLTAKVLEPAGIRIRCDGQTRTRWCPANGEDLALSVPEILSLLQWYLSQDDLRSHPELHVVTPPPGWCLERGACVGWKCYGLGWIGHNALYPQESLVVRVHPEHAIAIIVAGKNASAGLVMARLFGGLLPEYRNLCIPRPLRAGAAATNAEINAGTYANRALQVHVSSAGEGGLQAGISTSPVLPDRQPRTLHTRLTPGTDHTYLADPTAHEFFQWIQFIEAQGHPSCHLWDGQQVLRRVAPTA